MEEAKPCDRCSIALSYKLIAWFTDPKACIACVRDTERAYIKLNNIKDNVHGQTQVQ